MITRIKSVITKVDLYVKAEDSAPVRTMVESCRACTYKSKIANNCLDKSMPFARVNQSIFFFVHIPKTDGSSIESYLAQVGRVCLVAKRATGFSRVTSQHMERATFERYIPRGSYDHGFAIIRDPMDRLQSEFRHQVRLGKYHHKLAHYLRISDPRSRRDAGKQPKEYVWQNDFDGWVGAILPACKSDTYIFDNHIRPQVDYVLPAQKLFDLCDGLDQVVRWIDLVAGIAGDGASVPHKKRSRMTPLAASEYTRWALKKF